MSTHYDTLGISKDASQDDIKSAYRKLAMKMHPDKNPTDSKAAEVEFKNIGEAYSVLSDPQKRDEYDNGGAHGSLPYDFSPEQLFQHFMNGGVNLGSFNFIFQEQPIIHQMEVSLQELYTKTKKTIQVSLTREGNRCHQTFDVTLDPSFIHGHHIRFAHQGNKTHPHAMPGDVIVILHVANHPKFQRDGESLHYLHEISLKESLTGFSFILETLDKRGMNVIVQDVIISPESQHIIPHEEMTKNGNMVLHFQIRFPETLAPEVKTQLKVLLP